MMNRAAFACILLTLTSLPSFAQIVSVNPTPPPCAGNHCVNPIRGARIEHHGAASVQKTSCPAGTVYNSRKGTCRVMPVSR